MCHVCVCAGECHLWGGEPAEVREGHRIPWSWNYRCLEPPNTGAGNCTGVFCRKWSEWQNCLFWLPPVPSLLFSERACVSLRRAPDSPCCRTWVLQDFIQNWEDLGEGVWDRGMARSKMYLTWSLQGHGEVTLWGEARAKAEPSSQIVGRRGCWGCLSEKAWRRGEFWLVTHHRIGC